MCLKYSRGKFHEHFWGSFLEGEFLTLPNEICFEIKWPLLKIHDFIELVWKKCQLYEKMRQSTYGQCYTLACQALKNLITHNSAYQFTMDRIKTICLFYKVCVLV